MTFSISNIKTVNDKDRANCLEYLMIAMREIDKPWLSFPIRKETWCFFEMFALFIYLNKIFAKKISFIYFIADLFD